MLNSLGSIALLIAISVMGHVHQHALARGEDPVSVMRLISAKSGKGDPAFYRDRVCDEFAGTYISGLVKTSYDKKYVVKNWGAKDPDGGTSEVVDPVVTLDADTAVVRATVLDTSMVFSKQRTVFKTWVTDVYVLRKGKWRLLASTEVLVSQDPVKSEKN